MTAIGLMSGTSMDGIDVAMIVTDGEVVSGRMGSKTYNYDAAFRRRLATAIMEARSLSDRTERSYALAEIETEITIRHADAAAHFLADTGRARSDVTIVGFHGQTVLHRPEIGLTVQLGRGDELARLIGLPVAWDLRAADVAAGGQGAPMVPVYHRALAAGIADRPVAIVNIGGVANVTWIGDDGELLAFDTGPGNALIDDWMTKTTGAARDDGGQAALAGRPQESVVRFFLDHPFFNQPPPKSLDRNAFFWDLVEGLSVEDGAATLAEMTAQSIIRAREHMPAEPKRWIVAGGGRHNQAIMHGLQRELGEAVSATEALGLDGDAIEAEAWAFLAVRSLRGLALTYPGTTGVPHATTGGIISRL